MNLNQVTGPRRDILYYLKQHGPATVADLSSHLQMTGEAVRQHLLQLTQDKYIQRQSERAPAAGAGRPSLFYNLTVEGEHLFPKSYDGLTVELIDTIISELGEESLKQDLSSMTESRVQQWEFQLRTILILLLAALKMEPDE